jgi:hypothetical protein
MQTLQTPCKPHANPMQPCKPHANPMPTACQPHANPMPTPCQPHAHPIYISYTPCQPHANPMPNPVPTPPIIDHPPSCAPPDPRTRTEKQGPRVRRGGLQFIKDQRPYGVWRMAYGVHMLFGLQESPRPIASHLTALLSALLSTPRAPEVNESTRFRAARSRRWRVACR